MSSSRSTWLGQHFSRRAKSIFSDAGGAERGIEPELRLAKSVKPHHAHAVLQAACHGLVASRECKAENY